MSPSLRNTRTFPQAHSGQSTDAVKCTACGRLFVSIPESGVSIAVGKCGDCQDLEKMKRGRDMLAQARRSNAGRAARRKGK